MSTLTDAATVTVSVTVQVPPPCVINGNRTIEVDFGEILTVSVNGSNYKKRVDYTLECSGRKSNALQMKIQGNVTSFDPTALRTNINDFGVALHANGQPLNINSWLKFTYSDNQTPLLEAVPVKKAGKTLPGGAFTAGATLLVAYQ
ncbi:fimbrial protein MrfE [Serratia sp. FS14]|nr:fimbrial protein MrfE [Serratia sp. FS14]